jgi:hypothetical protein
MTRTGGNLLEKKKMNKNRVSKDMDSKQMEMHMKMMLRGVQNQP